MAPQRCNLESCKAKLPITAYACKCSGMFCSKHSFFNDHACSYDYQAGAKENLLKTMSTAIVSQKLEKL
jgi:hypothetical protein